MRVLFLLRKITCNDGIASYCETLASGLSSASAPVHLLCGLIECEPAEQERWEAIAASVFSWELLPHLRRVPDPFTFVALRRYVKEHAIDVINLHGLGMLLWAKLLMVTTGVRVVITYHPSVHGDPQQVSELALRPLSVCERLVLRWCVPHRLVVLSGESAEYLARQCPEIRHRIVKVNGAVDDRYFRPPTADERSAARQALSLSDDQTAVLHVGRMSWNKGQDLVIDAARQVRDGGQGSRLRCFFVGSGAEEDQMKERALQQDRDYSTFTFLGFVKDLRAVLWAADVFVLPSRLEGFALAVVEAMCAGLVVIRTPSGGAADQVIDGETGIIVPFNDVKSLTKAIDRLIDPAERARMRDGSIVLARERFTQSGMVRAMLSVYEG